MSGHLGHGVVIVLSIAKISNGDYYVKAVANGIEDYYALGEAPGRWAGHSADLLGLEGEIQPEQLTAVLAGRNPITGQVVIDSANLTGDRFGEPDRARVRSDVPGAEVGVARLRARPGRDGRPGHRRA